MKEGLKTALVSLIFSSVFVLALSLLIAFKPLSAAWVHGIDQGIKALSLLLASFLCIKDKSKGALKGLFAGTLYSLASFFLFGFAAGDFGVDVSLLADIGLGSAMGLICGALSVAFGKKASSY
ncbi:MAG: TIGR04086 family membrane protein [Clostridia bacterium]|nr:TIGR04086 family membrane protein [Clostridia bacterium]